MKNKTFTFKYDPSASLENMFQGFREAIAGRKSLQPRDLFVADSIETIYQTITKSRLELLACLVEKKPANINQLAELLNKDYANVWRDCQVLANCRIIKLKKEDKAVKPIALYGKIVFDLETTQPVLPVEETRASL